MGGGAKLPPLRLFLGIRPMPAVREQKSCFHNFAQNKYSNKSQQFPRTWYIDNTLRKPEEVSDPWKQASATKCSIPYQSMQALYHDTSRLSHSVEWCFVQARPKIRHVCDRQTYVIQHHRLMPPPSGRGHDSMNAYCADFLQNFLNSRYYFIIIIEIVHVA